VGVSRNCQKFFEHPLLYHEGATGKAMNFNFVRTFIGSIWTKAH